ncbi:MAG: hypothetical protein A7316_10755 [Candidatus Altiarchaeales archaeon WOR_SM1_86-2]|nr:MAG: hypothetical protein A7316_10755 [Candidatus Altiarchaeales archaeon WOR_SM1_86-2]ODS35581.1 MAG: hypothetical protein A7315_14605 [Candidatus Altiarchaeales archaeon WOR_SM1_79]
MDIQSIISNIPWWVWIGYVLVFVIGYMLNSVIHPLFIEDWVSNRKKKKKDEGEYKSQIKERVKGLIDTLEKCHHYPVGRDSLLKLQRPDADLRLSQKLDKKINDLNGIMATYSALFMYAMILIERELRNFVVSSENRRLYDEFLKKQDDVKLPKGMINLTLEFPNQLTQELISLIFSEEKIDEPSLRMINIGHKKYLDVLLNNDDAQSRLITKLRELKKGREYIGVSFGVHAKMGLLPFKELEDKRVELIKRLAELEKLL